jgi:hypothetical protein
VTLLKSVGSNLIPPKSRGVRECEKESCNRVESGNFVLNLLGQAILVWLGSSAFVLRSYCCG